MSFIGDLLGSVISPALGKPGADVQEEATKTSTNLANQAAAMARDYYARTGEMRGNIIDRLTDFTSGQSNPITQYNLMNPLNNDLYRRSMKFMEGGLDPTASPEYAPIKMTAERQFDIARDQALSDTPAGGGLFDTLANIGSQKAATMTGQVGDIVKDEYNKAINMNNVLNQIIQDEYNKAYSMGQGSQTVAASGVTAAGDSTSKLLTALASQQGAGAKSGENVVGLWKLIQDLYTS